MIEHALHLAVRHFLVGERHLHIELRKFRLAVRPEVFVAEAACDLVILVKARDHRELLQDLRRLRQGEEFARVNSRRHNKIACSLGRRFEQYRRLDLDKPTRVKILAYRRNGLSTSSNIVLQLRPSEVQITVFQTRIFSREILAARNLELKRQDVGVVKDENFGNLYLDLTGRKLRVLRTFVTPNDLAFDGDDEFATQILRLGMCLGRLFLAHHNLSHTIAVTQIDKRKNAKITLLRHPTHQHNLLRNIALAKLPTTVRSL